MANLGNTIINGILRVNGDINAGGSIKAPTLIGNLTGNASSATKLQTARKINGIAFDGTKDIIIEAGSSGHTILNSTGTTMAQRSKLKFMNSTVTDDSANDTTGNYLPLSGGTLTTNSYNGLTIKRSDANGSSILYSNSAGALGKIGFTSNGDLVITNGAGTDGTANMLKINSDGIAIFFNNTIPSSNNSRTLGTSALKWNNVYATTFTGALSGNATTASTLQTGRTINGTSFNGSANITTANWGTARNIGIVNSDGTGTAVVTSVNGSANINLKLPSTIKATLTGNASTASTLANARTINGTSFNGSANITTANWGTARSITIGSSTKSVNGSANVTWSLSEIGASPSSHVHNYLPLTGGTMTGTIISNMITNSHLDGNKGKAVIDIINSNANYVTVLRTNALNGKFTLSSAQDTLNLCFTENKIINEGKNEISHGISFWGSGYIIPLKNNTMTLGSPENKWANVYATTFTGNLSGNASTATTATKANQLTTARTISLTGDATANGSFNGTANLALSTTVKQIDAIEDRDIKPNVTPKGKFAVYFATKAGLNGTADSDYQDLLVMNTWGDTGGQNVNALAFDKNTKAIYHYQAAQTATTWGTAHQLAYTTSNVSSASILQTARTINGTSFNGSANITTANWGTGRNIGIVNSDGTGTAVPVSVNGSGNVNLKLPATIKASLSGNASTATTATKANQLTTARTIGVSGVTGTAQSFNGTANITIPITAVPASLLTGKNAIKASEINNDKHFIPSSTNTVANIVAMTQSSFNSSGSSLPNNTLVAITDGNDSYVSTQATGITCDLPLDL